MRNWRNPFRFRASEHIESDETFVCLFNPDVLVDLMSDDIWDLPCFIRSTPGAGKTSLLRMFTPPALLAAYELRSNEYIKSLFGNLTKLKAVNRDGPAILGIVVPCRHGFDIVVEAISAVERQKRILNALVNSRIVLRLLQAVMSLRRSSGTADLQKMELDLPDSVLLPLGLTRPCTGDSLHMWARDVEKRVCRSLDRFDFSWEESIPGDDDLLALDLLCAGAIKFDGKPIVDRVLLMFDDVHRLASTQRKFLIDSILTRRPQAAVWFAERLEGLDVNEMLSSGARPGRDYGRTIVLDNLWRDRRGKTTQRRLLDIATRRARQSDLVDVDSFEGCLAHLPDGTEWNSEFQKHAGAVRARAQKKAGGKIRYAEWLVVKQARDHTQTASEQAIDWRTFEILMARAEANSQGELFDIPLDSQGLSEQLQDSSLREASEFLLYREFGTPYYYGPPKLALMASGSIEQFLALAAGLFDEVMSAVLLGKSRILSPESQSRIVKKIAEEYWNGIPRGARAGSLVKALLESIGLFSRSQTERPTAPYAPGVTGIAIHMSEAMRLGDLQAQHASSDFLQLSSVIGSCIANNWLVAKPNIKCKKQEWMVLYLNRILCLHFDLPLSYGGWREKTLKELLEWLRVPHGYPTASEGDSNGSTYK